MKRIFPRVVFGLITVALLLIGWWLLQNVHIDVLEPHGVIAAEQKRILLWAIGLSVIVVMPVFTMLVVFSFRYRASNKKATYHPDWDSNKLLESIWWGIPILVISVLGVVTWQTSHSLDPYRSIASSNDTLEVQVVALQWKWLFIYPDEEIATVNRLVLPINTPVHFSLTADAPMSAFWIPSLGSQIYSMSGMTSQLNLMATDEGEYKGYSTNINGAGYADMTFMAEVLSSERYEKWAMTAKASPQDMNQKMYNKLALASIDRSERTYQLTEPDLYRTVVAKYMTHGNGQQHNSQHEMESME